MTVCGSAFAAPIPQGKTYNGYFFEHGEDTMALSGGTEIQFYTDSLYGVFKNATKIVKTVQQGEPGNTIKYSINHITNTGAPNKVHEAINKGDNIVVNNILKEGEYNGQRILYSNGKVDINFNTPYFRFQKIVEHSEYKLDDNGNVATSTIKDYYDANGKKLDIAFKGVNHMIQDGESSWTYSLTEPGLYMIHSSDALEDGMTFYVCIDKYYDNGGQSVVNDNKAVPGSLNVCVNGNWTTNVPMYTINGNKCMKVRALGKLLNGTSSQFNPYYNAGSKCTNLNQIENPYRNATSSYQEIGGELDPISSNVIDNPQKTEGYFMIKSITQHPSAYDINGWTYVRLDHVADYLGISISMTDTGNMYITA